MERWDAVERENLVTALQQAGPDQPTLCEGWQTRHLATHLYLRRHRPWQSFRQGEGSTFARLADEAADPARYAEIVDRFAAAPRTLTPMALQDGPFGMLTNHMEYVIHHEDARRGAGPVEPRVLPPEQADAVFDQTLQMASLNLRKVPVGLVLVVPGGRRKVVHKGADAVAVVGAPIELALLAFGRGRAAQIELQGSEGAVEAFQATLS